MEVHFSGAADAVRQEMRSWLGIESVSMIIPPKKGTKTAESAPAETKEPVKETPAAPATVAPATTPLTHQMVRDLVPLVAAKHGRPKAVELLAKYGAKGGGDLQEKDWAAFYKDAQAMLA